MPLRLAERNHLRSRDRDRAARGSWLEAAHLHRVRTDLEDRGASILAAVVLDAVSVGVEVSVCDKVSIGLVEAVAAF